MRVPAIPACAILTLSALVPAPAAGQEPVTLEEAVQRFHDGSPALALARSRLRAETAAGAQSRAAPNPVAAFSEEELDDYSERYLTVSQRIDFLWEAPARRRRADAWAARARARFQADSARLVREVKEEYLRAWQRREEASVLLRAEATVTALLADASERFAAGDLAGYDVRRLRVERARVARSLARAQVEEGLAEERLAAVLGGAGGTRLRAVPLEDAPPALDPAVDAVSLALGRRPEVAEARAAAEASRAEVGLARAALLSGATLGAGLKDQSDGRDGLFVEVQLPLPILDRKGAAADAARAEASGADSGAAWVERMVAVDASVARARVGAARRVADLVAEGGLADAEELLAIARVAYEEGEVGIVEVLDAADAFVEAGLLGIGARVELWMAHFELEQAVGGLPADMDRGGER